MHIKRGSPSQVAGEYIESSRRPRRWYDSEVSGLRSQVSGLSDLLYSLLCCTTGDSPAFPPSPLAGLPCDGRVTPWHSRYEDALWMMRCELCHSLKLSWSSRQPRSGPASGRHTRRHLRLRCCHFTGNLLRARESNDYRWQSIFLRIPDSDHSLIKCTFQSTFSSPLPPACLSRTVRVLYLSAPL